MSVVNTCLNNGYTLYHRPRNTGRRGGRVGVLINNHINLKSRMIGVNPEMTSFESMEEWFKTRYILQLIQRLSRETVMYE